MREFVIKVNEIRIGQEPAESAKWEGLICKFANAGWLRKASEKNIQTSQEVVLFAVVAWSQQKWLGSDSDNR